MKKMIHPRGFSLIELLLILSILGILLFLFVPFAKLIPVVEVNDGTRLPTESLILSTESTSIPSEHNQTDLQQVKD